MRRSALESVQRDENERRCDHPSCLGAGEYRAPKSRHELSEYYWFCLEHVRAYNRAWNYFEGMDQSEIEQFQKSALFGHRPTWRVGTGSGTGRRFNDPHRIFGDRFAEARNDPEETAPWRPGEKQALALLNLDRPVTLKAIKVRYKELVKLHHPDANGGSKESEERLKQINIAYAVLLGCGYT